MMKNGDICWAFVSFEDSLDGKKRPILIWNLDNQLIVFKITSRFNDKPKEIRDNYCPLFNWKKWD